MKEVTKNASGDSLYDLNTLTDLEVHLITCSLFNLGRFLKNALYPTVGYTVL